MNPCRECRALSATLLAIVACAPEAEAPPPFVPATPPLVAEAAPVEPSPAVRLPGDTRPTAESVALSIDPTQDFVLVPATRRLAAWGLVLLYVAVFPANVNMALNHIQLSPDGTLPVWAMWARLPFQALFIAWALWFTRADPRTARSL